MRGGKLLVEEPPAELIDFYQKDVRLYKLCFSHWCNGAITYTCNNCYSSFANSNILCSSFSLRVHIL